MTTSREALRAWTGGNHDKRPTRRQLRRWATDVLLELWNAERRLEREQKTVADLRRQLQRVGEQRDAYRRGAAQPTPESQPSTSCCSACDGGESPWLKWLQAAKTLTRKPLTPRFGDPE